METEIKYDTPIEVTQRQYNAIMSNCEGIVAGREEAGKYYIKVFLTKYSNLVKKHLSIS